MIENLSLREQQSEIMKTISHLSEEIYALRREVGGLHGTVSGCSSGIFALLHYIKEFKS